FRLKCRVLRSTLNNSQARFIDRAGAPNAPFLAKGASTPCSESARGVQGGRPMVLRKLKKLIDLVQESGIAELEITEGEEKVKIVKGGAGTVNAAPMMATLAPAPALRA